MATRPRFGATANRPGVTASPVGQPSRPVFGVQAGERPRFGVPVSSAFGTSPTLQGPPPGVMVSPTYGQERPDQTGNTLAEIRKRYQRGALSTLSGIFRVLRGIENAGAGFSKGAINHIERQIHDLGDGVEFQDIVQVLPPWIFMAATDRGFMEVPGAIKKDYTFEELVQESSDPGSFLYRYSMPIGLGLSIVADPTTYMSFGATGASKVAASHFLAKEWASSMDEALKSLDKGVNVATGEKIVPGTDVRDVWIDIQAARGRAFTTGDAMHAIKQQDIAQRGTGSRTLIGGIKSGTLRAQFARGGQGIRIAGQELPGTVGLGSKIAEKMGKTPVASYAQPQRLRSYAGSIGLVPRAKLYTIAEDATRAMFMSEVARINAKGVQTAEEVIPQAQALFKLPTTQSKEAFRRETPWAQRTGMALKHIFGITGNVPDYVPGQFRKNLLRADVSLTNNPYKQRLVKMLEEVNNTRDAYFKMAEEAGFEKHQIKNMEELWARLVDDFSDPVDVLSRFTGTVAAKIHTIDAIDQLLMNPMFARIKVDGLDDVDNLLTEVNKAHEALFKAKKAVHEKGINARQKSRRAREVPKKQEAYDSLKSQYDSAKAKADKAVNEAGGRGVRDVEAWGRIIDETAVPLPWKGKTFMVPEPIATAIGEMRNPKFIDTELNKFFRSVNWTQNKWKLLATSVNPSFHTMNLVGGMWNNLLGGVYNPKDYVQAYTDIYRARAAEGEGIASAMVGALPRGMRERMLEPGKVDVARARLEAFRERHAGGGMVREELYKKASKETITGGSKSKKRQAFTAARRGYVAATAASLVAPDEWVPDDIEALLNPLFAAGAGLPEFTRFGRYVANDVEETLRITPMKMAENDQSYKQLMELHSVEVPTEFGKFMGQQGLDLSRAQQEIAWDIGASMAIKYQFDYSDLTWMERYVAKSVFPFYVFYKNNFVLQVQEVVNRPRFINTFADLAGFTESLTTDEDNAGFRELLPEYFDKLSMFEVPVPGFMREKMGLPQDQPLYLNPKLPFASLNLFPPLWQLFNDNSVTPTSQKWMQILSPILGSVGPFAGFLPWKPMIEYSMGAQLGMAQPIDFRRAGSNNWQHSYVEAPGYAKFLPGIIRDKLGIFKDENGQWKQQADLRYITESMASPFISQAGDVFGGQTESQRADAVAWITGVRLTPVDPLRLQRSWMYRMESYLEGRRADLRARGQELDPDDARFLSQVRANIRVVERAWDKKQEELYGNG